MSSAGPAEQHRKAAPAASSIRVAVITASDSRTPATNDGGRVLRDLVEEAGFVIAAEALLAEDPAVLREEVAGLVRGGTVDVVLATGGTGVAPRDRTPEAIGPLFELRLPGFGELFRRLSFEAIGPAAMLSRAEAGVVHGVAVFLLPGSPAAVELAVSKLIAPELPHLVGQLRRPGHASHKAGDKAGDAG